MVDSLTQLKWYAWLHRRVHDLDYLRRLGSSSWHKQELYLDYDKSNSLDLPAPRATTIVLNPP